MASPILQRGRFTFDDEPDFAGLDGYHDPADRWNGWCKPFVTAEVAATLYERLANVTDSRDAKGTPRAGTHFRWYPETRVLVEVYLYDDAASDGFADGGPRYECPLETRATVDGEVALYPIASALCWTEVTP